MSFFPVCRWRAFQIPFLTGEERYHCSSPKLIVAAQGVNAAICSECPYCDQPLTDAMEKTHIGISLPVCVHLGAPVRGRAAPDLSRDWRECARGRGVVCTCQQCQVCPERSVIEPSQVIRLSLGSHDDKRLIPFNPSICRYEGQWLLAYRVGWGGGSIRLAVLNEQFEVVKSTPLTLAHERCSYAQEDPRLFVLDGSLCMSFAGVWFDGPTQRIDVLLMVFNDDLSAGEIHYPHYQNRTVVEKNWVFFEHERELFCSYQSHPRHEVLKVQISASLAYSTPTSIPWFGGFVRGGSSPIQHRGSYYHFFHGYRRAGSTHVYSVGVLRFENRPPFRVTHLSPIPVYSADQKQSPGGEHLSNKAIVYPCGAAFCDRKWVVSYGHHDSFCEIAFFGEDEIEGALLPVGK